MSRSPSAPINVDVWPGGCWLEEDLSELKALVSPFGVADGQRSENLRGLGLQVTLTFIAGAVAAGFFSALGEQLYNQLGEKLRAFLRRPHHRHPAMDKEGDDDGLFVIVQDREARVELHLYGYFGDEQQLAEYLQHAPRAYAAVMEAVRDGRSPCIHGRAHSVRAVWSKSNQPEWELSVIIREGDDPERGRSILSVETLVESDRLTSAEWHNLRWLDSKQAAGRRQHRRH